MERSKHLDIAKGILILCLCFCHFSHAVSINGIQSELTGNVVAWHYLFSVFFMQAFFLITGYCSNFQKPAKSFFGNNLKTLAIPAIIFTFMNRLIIAIVYSTTLKGVIETLFNGVGFWFLWTLLFCKIIHWFLKRLTIRTWLLFSIYLTMIFVGFESFLLGLPNILYHQQVCTMCLFLYLGEYLKEKNCNITNSIGYMYIIVILAISIFDIPYSIISGTIVVGSVKEMPIYLITVYCGTLFVLCISKVIKKCALLEEGGKYSLCIYGFHFFIVY